MPNSVYTLTDKPIQVKYREPYLSQTLNRKYQTIIPFGIYSGFVPVPGGALELLLDSGTASHVAVVQSDTDPTAQISVQLEPGSIALDLSSYASMSVAIVAEISYAFPSDTAGSIKVYDLATEIVPPTACTICKVDVPASGAIPGSSISLDGRTLPWENASPGSKPYFSIVKNGNFLLSAGTAPTDMPPPYWGQDISANSKFVPESTPCDEGVIGYVSISGVATDAVLFQTYYIPIPPDSSGKCALRLKIRGNVFQVPTSGNPKVKLFTANKATGAIDETFTITVDNPIGNFSYDETFQASVASDCAFIYGLSIEFDSAEYASTGDAFQIYEVDVLVENTGTTLPLGVGIGGSERLDSLTLLDGAGGAAPGAVLEYDSDTLSVSRNYSGTPPNLLISGEIYANGGISRSTPGTLEVGNSALVTQIDVGTSAATGDVRLSRAGSNTRVLGNLLVDEDASTTGTLTSGDDFTVGSSTFTVTASTGDTYVTGTLTVIGTTTLGTISIGGDLTVTGVIYAHGGIQRSIGGAISIGTTGATTAINIGTTAGGTVTIGRAGTTTAISGPVTVASTLDTPGASTLTLGGTNATTVTIGSAPVAGSRVANLLGNTVNIGVDADTTAISVGTTSTSSATVSIGNAPTSGTTTTAVQGNTVNLGTDADTSTIGIGTAAPTASRAITVGANSASSTLTAQGSTITLGGSSTATLSVGSSSTSSATLTIGNAPTGGTVTTTVEGNTVNIGEDVDNSAINIGTSDPTGTRLIVVGGNYAGQSTVLYGQTIYAGDSATSALSIGTSTTTGATVSIGNAPSGGTTKLFLQGNTITLGTDADTASLTIGHGAIVTSIYAGTGLRLLGATTYVDTTTSAAALNIGVANAGTITIGRTTRTLELDSTTVNISELSGVTTVRGSLVVAQTGTINGGIDSPSLDNAGASLTIGASSSSLTLGQTGSGTTIRGSTTTINITSPSGSTFIGRSGQLTGLYGNVYAYTNLFTPVIDEVTPASTLQIAPSVAGRVEIGKSATSQAALGSLFAAEKLYVGVSLSGTAATRVQPPAIGVAYITSDALLSSTNTKLALLNFVSQNMTVNTVTDQVESIPPGYYKITFSMYGYVDLVTGLPTNITFDINPVSGITVYGQTAVIWCNRSTPGTIYTDSDAVYVSYSAIAFVSSGTGTICVNCKVNAGTLTLVFGTGLDVNTAGTLIVERIGSYSA